MMHPGELLSAFLDGELTADEHRTLVAHLDSCGDCRGELEGLHRARSALRSLPVFEVPPGVVPEIDELAEVVPLRRRPQVWIAAAAAAVIIFVSAATALAPDRSVPISYDEIADQYGTRAQLDPVITPGKVAPPVFILPEGSQ